MVEMASLIEEITKMLVFTITFFITIFVIIGSGKIIMGVIESPGQIPEEKKYFLSKPINEIIKHLNLDKNEQNITTVEVMISRFEDISSAFQKLYEVEKEEIRKQNFEYFDVACCHEYDSIKKVMELVDRGIPTTHNNVLELLEVIVEGLENKYNEFLNLSTEEVIRETKDLKLLQQKEIEDGKFITVEQ